MRWPEPAVSHIWHVFDLARPRPTHLTVFTLIPSLLQSPTASFATFKLPTSATRGVDAHSKTLDGTPPQDSMQMRVTRYLKGESSSSIDQQKVFNQL
jgi:hypothetical protein